MAKSISSLYFSFLQALTKPASHVIVHLSFFFLPQFQFQEPYTTTALSKPESECETCAAAGLHPINTGVCEGKKWHLNETFFFAPNRA